MWNALKDAIKLVIKENKNQEITGPILQNVLLSAIDNLGEHSTFAGIAEPEFVPVVPDGRIFYIASKKGIYSNFGGVELIGDEVLIFDWTETGWNTIYTGIATLTAINLIRGALDVLIDRVDVLTGIINDHSYSIYALQQAVAILEQAVLELQNITPDPDGGTMAFSTQFKKIEGIVYLNIKCITAGSIDEMTFLPRIVTVDENASLSNMAYWPGMYLYDRGTYYEGVATKLLFPTVLFGYYSISFLLVIGDVQEMEMIGGGAGGDYSISLEFQLSTGMANALRLSGTSFILALMIETEDGQVLKGMFIEDIPKSPWKRIGNVITSDKEIKKIYLGIPCRASSPIHGNDSIWFRNVNIQKL